MTDVIASLKKVQEGCGPYSGERNAIDWVINWLRPADKKKAAPQPPTEDGPLRLSIVFAYGSSIVGQVEVAEVGDEVALTGEVSTSEEYKLAKKLANMFVEAGFICKVCNFRPRPAEPIRSAAARPIQAPARAPFVHVLHLPG